MFIWKNKPLQWVEGWSSWHLEWKNEGPLCKDQRRSYASTQSLRLWKPAKRCDLCLKIVADRLGIS